jgi:hypothetical protein
MRIEDIENYIIKNFDDIHPLNSWGEKSFFLNPNKKLKRGTYFATLKTKDGENDNSSFLDRDNVFRLNMGITKEFYLSLFSHIPERPAKGCFIKGDYNFQKLNTILPHPIYAWMGWICVLNPDSRTFEECKNLLNNAYDKAHQITMRKLSK